jgi:hypothetical protein
MAKPRFNAGKFIVGLAVVIAVALVAAFVLNQLQARGLV